MWLSNHKTINKIINSVLFILITFKLISCLYLGVANDTKLYLIKYMIFYNTYQKFCQLFEKNSITTLFTIFWINVIKIR